jgi:hypothetical protein
LLVSTQLASQAAATTAYAPAGSAFAPAPPPPLPVARPPVGTLQRAQQVCSRAVAVSAFRVRRLGARTTLGLLAAVLALGLYLGQNLQQLGRIAALKSQIDGLTVATPVAKPAAAVAPSAAALPRRSEASGIVEAVAAQADASGVQLARGEYEFLPARDGVAARYRMSFPLHTSYPRLRQFLDRTLIALPAVAVESLHIERKSVGDENIDAELTLSAFVRSDE